MKTPRDRITELIGDPPKADSYYGGTHYCVSDQDLCEWRHKLIDRLTESAVEVFTGKRPEIDFEFSRGQTPTDTHTARSVTS